MRARSRSVAAGERGPRSTPSKPHQVRYVPSGAHEVDRCVRESALDEVHVGANQVLYLALPGLAPLVGGDRAEGADDVGIVAHVRGEHVPALAQRRVWQNHLRGGQSRDVPAFEAAVAVTVWDANEGPSDA